MGTPSKKRKLINSQASPSTVRSLDYFFGKQKDSLPTSTPESTIPQSSRSEPLTDEELARKLQAEWDKESADGTTGPAEIQEEGLIERLPNPVSDLAVRPEDQLQNSATEAGIERSTGAELLPAEAKSKNTLSLQSVGSAEDAVTYNIPLDESPLSFDPSKYVKDLQAIWAAEGGNATYALLTRCFVLVNSTQSRIKIVDTLVNLLRVIIEGDPNSLLPTVCILNCHTKWSGLPLPNAFNFPSTT